MIIYFYTLFLLILIYRIFAQGGIYNEISGFDYIYSSEFENIRNNLSNQSEKLLPQPQASLLSGMVLGVKEDLPFEFKKALTNTSTIHMVVVSGQNLTLLSGFVLGFASLIGRKKALYLSLFSIVFYALLTGFQIPVLRAAIMAVFGILAVLSGREKDSPHFLVLSAVLMLIYNPNWLLSVSFQLSFAATIGVMIIAPVLASYLKKFPDVIKADFAMTVCAQIMTMPIIAANFHQFSTIGLLSNILLLWTVPYIMVLGALSILVSLINLGLGQITAIFSGVLLTYFVYIVEFTSSALQSIYVPKLPIVIWIGYYIFVLGMYIHLKNKNNSRNDELI